MAKQDPNNYRKHSDRNKELINKSLAKLGAGRSVLIDSEDYLIAGNGVMEQAEALGIPTRVIETDGTELVVVKRTDLTLNDPKRKELALADNATSDTSEWNIEALESDWGGEELADEWDVSVVEWQDLPEYTPEGDNTKYNSDGGAVDENGEAKEVDGSLAERFIIPPFSVFDTKQGYWQNRKRLWKSLGIDSEIGRGENLIGAPDLDKDSRTEFKTGFDGAAPQTSIFDPVLGEVCYKWFCPDGGKILDPFAGGSVRGIVAIKSGFTYLGLELREEQVAANRGQADKILTGDKPEWRTGDSNVTLDDVKDGSVDMIFSCPPYADLEVYSDMEDDISNMPYNDFLEIYRSIINKTVSKLKENRFAVFIVGDVRDERGFYHGFPEDTVQAFKDAGAIKYNECLLLEQPGTAAMRAARTFNGGRKVCKTHQNVLVFYKGDPKKIKANFPEIDLSHMNGIDPLPEGVEEL